ncbi:MAG TPA: DNA repair protein RecO [Gammaproteobacteria bacterium]|nr:DNA repair protein RecO [Gammaproteobacteria bacterium]
MRVQSQPAFLLHARPFRETSLIIEVFSRQYGRVGLLARGVRNPKSRKRALVMPFQSLLLGWSGKGELPLLTSIEATGRARELAAEQRYAAFYLNELLLKLLYRYDAHESLFDYYNKILDEIYQGVPIQHTLRRFEKELLSQSGYGLILHHEAGSSRPVVAEGQYQYIPERGPRPVSQTAQENHSEEQGIYIKGKSLLDYYHDVFYDKESLKECRRLVRHLLDRQLGGKPLHSRRVFHQVLSGLS